MYARIAAGDTIPASQALFHNESERQSGNTQKNTFDTQSRQADHRTHQCRQSCGKRQGQGKRHAVGRQHRGHIRPHPHECRIAYREQTREAGKQHQAQTYDAVDHDKGQLSQPIFLQPPRRRDQGQQEQAIPKHMALMACQLYVLVVTGFENKTHMSDLFAQVVAKQAVRFEHQHQQHHHIGGDIFESLG